MPRATSHLDGSPDPDLPPTLAAAMRGAYEAPIDVPKELDEAILRDARAGFARRRRFVLAVRWVGSAAAVAAAVVIIVVNLHRGRGPATNVAISTIAGDVDGNGRVDILDAFVLARRVEAGSAGSERRGDVNRDGVVDRRDVDAIAAIAVRLPGGNAQ